MPTVVRAKISQKNKYWISKNRYYELKHFCLQYPEWKSMYLYLDQQTIGSNSIVTISKDKKETDFVAKMVIRKAYLSDRIDLIERTAKESDPELSSYILDSVTKEHSYQYLYTNCDIPCSRDEFYDRYRKFFWLLSKER